MIEPRTDNSVSKKKLFASLTPINCFPKKSFARIFLIDKHVFLRINFQAFDASFFLKKKPESYTTIIDVSMMPFLLNTSLKDKQAKDYCNYFNFTKIQGAIALHVSH